ncbi:DNA repair protein REV1 [Acrasis kona]|uniref:DNA repair protein REV1 n=1 Tax=Acrasis kona TaxID=1008807 RepID=A0AAW2Z2I7_9EUKA
MKKNEMKDLMARLQSLKEECENTFEQEMVAEPTLARANNSDSQKLIDWKPEEEVVDGHVNNV